MAPSGVHGAAFGCSSHVSARRWSLDQFAQVVDHQMRAMTLQLLRIPLACDADHKPELPIGTGLNSGNGILDDHRPYRLNTELLCRYQERIRGRVPGKSLCLDQIAVDPHFEQVV